MIVATAVPGLGGARLEDAEQLGVEVERGHGVAGVGEPERDPPGAGADVEDAFRGVARELAPQRQIGLVAAALDVVPDGVLGDDHRQYASAWPRRVSSSRSSSSAV